jgi:hypothetical protein
MWQLKEQQYDECGYECHERHERHDDDHVLGRELYAGHLGDIVHKRFLRDELAEAIGRGREG